MKCIADGKVCIGSQESHKLGYTLFFIGSRALNFMQLLEMITRGHSILLKCVLVYLEKLQSIELIIQNTVYKPDFSDFCWAKDRHEMDWVHRHLLPYADGLHVPVGSQQASDFLKVFNRVEGLF